MLPWLCHRRETAERIDAEAYVEARRREYEVQRRRDRVGWSRVALAFAQKTGKRIGLATSTRMAMNAVFAPDREHAGDRQPQPFSQADELKSALDLNLQRFLIQFIGADVNRGPTIVTEVEI